MMLNIVQTSEVDCRKAHVGPVNLLQARVLTGVLAVRLYLSKDNTRSIADICEAREKQVHRASYSFESSEKVAVSTLGISGFLRMLNQ